MPLEALIDERSALRRPHLAEQALEGLAPAPAYRPLTAMRVAAPVAAIQTDDGATNELLFGEAFDVLETSDGRAWGRARRDGRIGQVSTSELAPLTALPLQRVTVLTAVVHAEPTVRAETRLTLPMNALVTVDGREGGFLHLEGLGWVAGRSVSDIGDFDADPADVAERFLGAPLRQGGRTGAGVDADGLIRQALLAVGRAARAWPEDLMTLGPDVGPQGRRGDLAFVIDAEGRGVPAGILADARHLIHPCADAGRVLVEGLGDAARGRALSLRRPAP